ncbi:DUF4340 domain-containing protein [bacterium]|nr:DUF4340 domain-containing protein [bacterium]
MVSIPKWVIRWAVPIGLSVGCLVIAGLIRSVPEKSDAGELTLISPGASVQSVILKGKEPVASLEKSKGVLRFTNAAGVTVDQQVAEGWIKQLRSFPISRKFAPAAGEDYGFSTPQFSVALRANDRNHMLIIGQQRPDGLTYVMADGQPVLVPTERVSDWFKTDSALRTRHPFAGRRFGEVDSFAIRIKGDPGIYGVPGLPSYRVFSRAPASEWWWAVTGNTSEIIDPDLVVRLMNLIQTLSISDYVSDSLVPNGTDWTLSVTQPGKQQSFLFRIVPPNLVYIKTGPHEWGTCFPLVVQTMLRLMAVSRDDTPIRLTQFQFDTLEVTYNGTNERLVRNEQGHWMGKFGDQKTAQTRNLASALAELSVTESRVERPSQKPVPVATIKIIKGKASERLELLNEATGAFVIRFPERNAFVRVTETQPAVEEALKKLTAH